MQCTKMEGSPHENWNSIIYIQEKNNTQDWNRVMCTNSHVHGHAPKADYNLWRPVRETLSWHLNIWKVKFDYFKNEKSFQSEIKLYDPFLWVGFICLKATEPLWADSLLFTIKCPEISGTHLINLGRMKGWVNLGATQWFWTQDHWFHKCSLLDFQN